MKNVLKILCCVSFLALASNAADMPARGPVGFKVYDTNKDGFISEDEFNAVKAARMSANAETGRPMKNAGNSPDFSFFDTNKDGKISPAELEKGQRQQLQGRGGNKQ